METGLLALSLYLWNRESSSKSQSPKWEFSELWV